MRVATFNIENLDDKSDSRNPPLEVRAPVLRTILNRLNADILCLQEVHGQELPDHTSDSPKRNFAALDFVLQGTRYEGYKRAHTVTSAGVPFDVRNLLILVDPSYSMEFNQHKHTDIDKLQYRKVTSVPPEEEAKDITWERPILHAKINVDRTGILHLLNLRL